MGIFEIYGKGGWDLSKVDKKQWKGQKLHLFLDK